MCVQQAITCVVGTIGVLLVGRHRLCLFLGVADTDQVAVGDALQPVAGSAHLSVHLMPTPDGRRIVCLHHAVVRPGVLRGVEDIAIRARSLRSQNERGTASRSSCGEPPEQPVTEGGSGGG